MINRIGDFNFLQFVGGPEFPSGDIEIVARPGVDGVALWFTGVRGKPFSIVSLVDAPDLIGAYDLYEQYNRIVGAGVQNMVWRNVGLVGYGIVFAVLMVRPLQIRQVAKFVGGFNNNPTAICRCEWTLLPVAL